MCAPTTTKENTVAAQSQQRTSPQNGVLYGTIGLALAVTAGTATMGHFNSRRDQLGCDAMCVGSMTSVRSTLTLLGSTVIGRFSDTRALDRFGGARKICLLVGLLASLLETTVASHATTTNHLWISMIPAALLNQNFSVLKALFGEYHDAGATAADRAGSVGKLGMAAGLAFMVGPMLSALIFQTYEQAAMFAAFCLLLSALSVLALPSPTRQTSEKDDVGPQKKQPQNESILQRLLPDFVPAARTPAAIYIMISRICMGLAFHIFQTIWTVALRERFHFQPKDYGRYFSFIGFCFAMSQGFLAKAFLQRFGQTPSGKARLLMACSLMLGLGRLVVYQTSDLLVVYAIFGGIVTALGVINTIFTADTSNIADPSELGGLFGVLASVESMAGIAGPVLGGALAKVNPIQGPLMAVVSLYGIVFSMVYFGYEKIVIGQPNSKSKTV